MTLQQLKAVLDGTGLPWAYRQWEEGEAPALPYGVFYAGRSNPFEADGVVYSSSQRYTLELYSRDKDPESEAVVEGALTTAGIFYTKDEAYISSERMNEVIYEIEV